MNNSTTQRPLTAFTYGEEECKPTEEQETDTQKEKEGELEQREKLLEVEDAGQQQVEKEKENKVTLKLEQKKGEDRTKMALMTQVQCDDKPTKVPDQPILITPHASASKETQGDVQRDKSVRRRLFQWANEKAKNYISKKTERTLVREQEGGSHDCWPCKTSKCIISLHTC